MQSKPGTQQQEQLRDLYLRKSTTLFLKLRKVQYRSRTCDQRPGEEGR